MHGGSAEPFTLVLVAAVILITAVSVISCSTSVRVRYVPMHTKLHEDLKAELRMPISTYHIHIMSRPKSVQSLYGSLILVSYYPIPTSGHGPLSSYRKRGATQVNSRSGHDLPPPRTDPRTNM